MDGSVCLVWLVSDVRFGVTSGEQSDDGCVVLGLDILF